MSRPAVCGGALRPDCVLGGKRKGRRRQSEWNGHDGGGAAAWKGQPGGGLARWAAENGQPGGGLARSAAENGQPAASRSGAPLVSAPFVCAAAMASSERKLLKNRLTKQNVITISPPIVKGVGSSMAGPDLKQKLQHALQKLPLPLSDGFVPAAACAGCRSRARGACNTTNVPQRFSLTET